MAELTKPSATASSASSPKSTSVQPRKTSNIISLLAPVLCILAGYIIWRFIIGAPSNFRKPDTGGGFWPKHEDPIGALPRMYLGGIIVPLVRIMA